MLWFLLPFFWDVVPALAGLELKSPDGARRDFTFDRRVWRTPAFVDPSGKVLPVAGEEFQTSEIGRWHGVSAWFMVNFGDIWAYLPRLPCQGIFASGFGAISAGCLEPVAVSSGVFQDESAFIPHCVRALLAGVTRHTQSDEHGLAIPLGAMDEKIPQTRRKWMQKTRPKEKVVAGGRKICFGFRMRTPVGPSGNPLAFPPFSPKIHNP